MRCQKRARVLADKVSLVSDSHSLRGHFEEKKKFKMESPLLCDNPNCCNMSFEELKDIVQTVDVGAYFSFIHCVPPEDRNRQGMLSFLMEHEPYLFRLAENMAEVYQNAYFLAVRQREALIESYVLLKVAKNTVESMQSSLAKELEKQDEKAKPAREKKRAREKKNLEEEKEEHTMAAEHVKRAIKVAHVSENKFYAQEKFSPDFGFEKYVHVVPKGKARKNLDIFQSGSWETIFHCNGPWQAEQLVEELKSEGRKCVIIKRARGGMDTEVLSYKVVASAK